MPDDVPPTEESPAPDAAVPPERLARRAVRATDRAGQLLRERFRTPVEADYGTDDVTTAVDRRAEELIRETIRDAYPDHAVTGEELGHTPGGPVEWLVDPIDGTNNYAVGHPTVAVAVSARRAGRALAAAIHEPLLGETLVAADGRDTHRLTGRRGPHSSGDSVADATDGPTDDLTSESPDRTDTDATAVDPFDTGTRVQARYDRPLASSTVSFVVGVEVVRDEERFARARATRDRLAERAKRTLETWAPCVDWGHLVRGDIAGLVAVAPDDRETVPGLLAARGAGVRVERHGEWLLAAPDPDTLPDLRDALPASVRDE